MPGISRLALYALVALLGASATVASAEPTNKQEPQNLLYPKEGDHLVNLRQLTFGGQNAEAYFSADGEGLIFQSTRNGMACDAIFRMDVDGSNVRMVSSGKGAATCAFIAPDNQSIIYASTHLAGAQCPPEPISLHTT